MINSKSSLYLLWLLVGLLILTGSHYAQASESDHLPDTLSDLTLKASDIMVHVNAFQTIADQHDGQRAVGTSGGKASEQYIIDQAEKTSYAIELMPFKNRNDKPAQNIMVKIAGQQSDEILMLGAHYDSVTMGSGINDNASGTALLLDFIQQLASHNIQPHHTLYIAFWDSEEDGIGGSSAFVETLTASKLQAIKAYINIDMIGTKEPDVLIADADKSSVDALEKKLKQQGGDMSAYQTILDGLRAIPSHPGDVKLEQLLKTFMEQLSVTIKEDTSMLTASDTAPFLGKVPVATLSMFHERLKGDELEFAPCYHQACDTVDLVEPTSIQLAADALLYLINQLEP